MSRARLLLCGGLLLAGAALAQAVDGPTLRFDPFERPELESPVAVSRERTDEWEPVLRGTLVAGDASLANLGGVVLSLGEASHGYQLLEVRTFEADFERNGQPLTLSVSPPAANR